MISIEDFGNKELINALCNFFESENCDYDTYEELSECIRSGTWLKHLEEDLNEEA